MKEVVLTCATYVMAGDSELEPGNLWSVFNLDEEEDEDGGYLSPGGDAWLDCDYAKTRKNSWRGDHQYISAVGADGRSYVIFQEDLDEVPEWVKAMVKAFESENLGKFTQLNRYDSVSWSDWDEVPVGIAYRGGSGYTYGLWVPTDEALVEFKGGSDATA